MNGGFPSRRVRNLDNPDFDALLGRLDPDPARGIEKYQDLRRRLVRFFGWNECSSAAEDLADLTLDTVGRKPGDLVIDDLIGYALGVARNVLADFRRKRKREVSFGDFMDAQTSDSKADPEATLIAALDLQTQVRRLNRCLNKLDSEDHDLALDYYTSEASTHIAHRRDLARRLGISMNNLRARINRVRARLEECLAKCGKSNELA